MTGWTAEPSYDVGAWAALSRRLSPYLDVTVALVATALALTSLLATTSTELAVIDTRLEPANLVAVAATAAAGLSLVWRRSRPTPAFAVFVAGCLVVTLTNHYIGLLSLILLFSLYSLAAHGRRRDGLIGLLLALVIFGGLALADVPDLGKSDVVQAGALLVTAWAIGDAIRSRRAQQHEQLHAAEREASAARDEALQAVTEERLRIARELHDVIAHSMSLIAVQAGVGGHVIRTDRDAAEHALGVIADTSRRALEQTRSMLGLLRDSDGSFTDPPTQTMGDLGALLDDVRGTGTEVTLTITGEPRPLDAGVELTAYRVVQESLTNVLKHSALRSARVLVAYEGDTLDIEVVDDGGPSPRTAPTSGHGLVGLRERTRLLGGTLDYGPLPGAGFRVRARLPAPSLEGAS